MIIKSEQIDVSTPTGLMRTYVYSPVPEGSYPGIVLFSEIFQQTEPIKRSAIMLAGHGFIVAVPEIFHELEKPGCIIPYDQEGADKGNKNKISKSIKAYDDDAVAAINLLKANKQCSGKIGAMGMCIGGHLAFRAAMNPQVLGSVCFYATDIHKRSLGLGQNDNSLDRIPEISGELMMIWGRQDPHVPKEGRALVREALEKADRHFTWHEFNGQHAFMRDEGARFDPELALHCYQMAVSFFNRTLGKGVLSSRNDEGRIVETKH